MGAALARRPRRRSTGAHYAFDDVWLEPKPFRPDGPRLWFGGQRLHDRLLRRLVAYGHGFNPLGRAERRRPRAARRGDGATPGEIAADLELVGGTRGAFPEPDRPAPLDAALDQIPEQVARGFGTICIKPSQFTDDPAEVPALLVRIVDGVAARAVSA